MPLRESVQLLACDLDEFRRACEPLGAAGRTYVRVRDDVAQFGALAHRDKAEVGDHRESCTPDEGKARTEKN